MKTKYLAAIVIVFLFLALIFTLNPIPISKTGFAGTNSNVEKVSLESTNISTPTESEYANNISLTRTN